MSPRIWSCLLVVGTALPLVCSKTPEALRGAEPARDLAVLQAGFGEVDITPLVGKKPVYMAGFGKNRKAADVHDPLVARAVVLADGHSKIAIVSVDLVGLFHPFIEKIRQRLPG